MPGAWHRDGSGRSCRSDRRPWGVVQAGPPLHGMGEPDAGAWISQTMAAPGCPVGWPPIHRKGSPDHPLLLASSARPWPWIRLRGPADAPVRCPPGCSPASLSLSTMPGGEAGAAVPPPQRAIRSGSRRLCRRSRRRWPVQRRAWSGWCGCMVSRSCRPAGRADVATGTEATGDRHSRSGGAAGMVQINGAPQHHGPAAR